MLFRDLQGNLIEIKKTSFLNDKDYNNFIINKLFKKKKKESESVLDYLTQAILSK